MSDEQRRRDLEDRIRAGVKPDDVGTAASASVGGEVPADTEPSKPISAAGGAAGGAAAGMTAGMVTLGPIGSVAGAIAGAVGGAAVGAASGRDAAPDESDDEDVYRRHFESDEQRLADRAYEDVRPAYQLGRRAAAEPEYVGQTFDEIEPYLRERWSEDAQHRHGSWEQASRYARAAYERERGRTIGRVQPEAEMAGTESHQRATFSDPIPPGDPDNVAGPAQPIPGRED